MSVDISRFGETRPYAVGAETDAEILDASQFAGGSIELEAANTVYVYGCNFEDPAGKVFKKSYDNEGYEKKIVAADARHQDLPNLHGMRWMKLVGTSATVQLHRAG
jgi:hypothetical protein